MINKNPAPAKAIADLWLSTKLNKEVKTLLFDKVLNKINNKRNGLQSIATFYTFKK